MTFTESYHAPGGKEYKATGKDYAEARAGVAEQIAADLAAYPGETWHVSYFRHDVLSALRLLCRHPLPGTETPPHLHRHLTHLLLAADQSEGIDAVAAFIRDHPGEWDREGARSSLVVARKSLSYRSEDRFYLTLWALPGSVNVSITRNFQAASEDGHTTAPQAILTKIAEVAADRIASGDTYYDLNANDLPGWLRAPVRTVLLARAADLHRLADTVKDP